MKFYLIAYDENDRSKKVSLGINGNIIIRNKTDSKNVYFDKVLELTKEDLTLLGVSEGAKE